MPALPKFPTPVPTTTVKGSLPPPAPVVPTQTTLNTVDIIAKLENMITVMALNTDIEKMASRKHLMYMQDSLLKKNHGR